MVALRALVQTFRAVHFGIVALILTVQVTMACQGLRLAAHGAACLSAGLIMTQQPLRNQQQLLYF